MIEEEEEGTKSCARPLRGSVIIHGFDKQEELESTKAKVGKVREENERLKLLLSKMVNDYKSLQMHFVNVLRRQDQEACKKQPQETSLELDDLQDIGAHDHLDFSLCLGRDSKNSSNKADNKSPKNTNADEKKKEPTLDLGFGATDNTHMDTDKSVRLENSSRDLNNENEVKLAGEMWTPRKVVKTMRSEDDQEEEILGQLPCSLKKTRVCLRVRCDARTMNDGCQWRKYGQKTAKGNPLPRAYYRCTISPSCPVRKQVQRSAEDSSILMITYEGTHDHPLPTAATAMATATSAAASILQNTSSASSSSSVNLHSSLNHFFPLNNFSISTSTSNSHPTVTLDLTFPNKRLPNYPSSSSTSHLMSFSSSDPTMLHSNVSNFNRSFMGYTNNFAMNRQASLGYTDALTAAITSNPSFRTALAAAFTSQAEQHRGTGGHHNTCSTPSLPLSSPFSASARAAADHRELHE